MGLFLRKSVTVGLDIGSGLIKLVAISHASGGPVLTKVAFAPIGNDAIVEGEIMDPGIVAEAIKGLMASAGVKTKSVVTAVGGLDGRVVALRAAEDELQLDEVSERVVHVAAAQRVAARLGVQQAEQPGAVDAREDDAAASDGVRDRSAIDHRQRRPG